MAEPGGVVGERRWLWPALAGPGVVWLVLLFLTPFYAILTVAMGRLDPLFNTPIPEWNPIYWNPAVFGEVFSDLFGGPLTDSFVRTLAYVITASILALLIGYPVAYYISRRAGRWKIPLLVLLVAPFWINYIMRMLAWVNLLDTDGYVNQGLMLFGVLDEPVVWLSGRHDTVILGLVYGYVPYLILPLFAALDRIDPSLIEAARDLGASPFRAFRRVTLPLSKQGILAGLVIIMLPMFGDYYTPDLLSGRTSTNMIGNDIELLVHTGIGKTKGAALTLILMSFVALLMLYYLFNVLRAQREARA
ncbi:MAG: ABC transporter permease [Haloechinothrix sp.]|jgi:ABC-type spermidine/putrescine transport system permease subunit I